MTHAWCRDVARDAAVRAAEDGRTVPLPTLEQCIERQNQSQMARPCGGTDPATLGGEPSVAGNGLRTERVVLEVKHFSTLHADQWAWGKFARPVLVPGESVRVVEDEERPKPPTTKTATTENDYVPPAPATRPAETSRTQAERVGGGWWFPKYDKPSAPPPPPPAPPRVHRGSGVFDANGDEVPWKGVVATLTEQRDAAIRERDALRMEIGCLTEENGKLRRNLEAAQARVAELEAASGGGEQPRGWLTEKEREAVIRAESQLGEEYCHGPSDNEAAAVLRGLLARSSPPEVVLPRVYCHGGDGEQLVDIKYVRAALAAAGVAMKDVGNE